MKKSVYVLLIALLYGGKSVAQKTEEPLVRVPIQQLFDGMKKSDSTLVRQSLVLGARLETVTKTNQAKWLYVPIPLKALSKVSVSLLLVIWTND